MKTVHFSLMNVLIQIHNGHENDQSLAQSSILLLLKNDP
jgi:hypothetical protein